MDIHSSWISLEKIICFKKSDRTKENCSILGVKKGAQKAEIVLVSGKDLTTWNFVRKFFGFGPLAGIDLHIRSVNNLLEKKKCFHLILKILKNLNIVLYKLAPL